MFFTLALRHGFGPPSSLLVRLSLAILSMSFSVAAFAGPPFAVDDPGTVTPGQATWLNGSQIVTADHVDLSALSSTFTAGFSRDQEVGITLGGYRLEVPEGRLVVGDTYLNFKKRFQNESAGRMAVAFAYQIRLPTGNTEVGSGTPGVDQTLYLTAGKILGGSASAPDLFGNIGYTYSAGGCENLGTYFYGAGLSFPLSHRLQAGMDITGSQGRPSFSPYETLGTGLCAAYNLDTCNVVVTRAAYGWRGESQGFSLFIGWQINITLGREGRP